MQGISLLVENQLVFPEGLYSMKYTVSEKDLPFFYFFF